MRLLRVIIGLFGILLAAITFMQIYMQLLNEILEGGQFVFQLETLVLSLLLVLGGIFALASFARKIIGKIGSIFYAMGLTYYVLHLDIFQEYIYILAFLIMAIIVMWIPSKEYRNQNNKHVYQMDSTDKKLEQLKTLKALYDSKVLSDAEFLEEKSKILKKYS